MKWKPLLETILKIGFAGAAIYHLIGLIHPEWTEPAPFIKHLLFIFINAAGFFLLWNRSRFFWPFLVILTLEQIYSHGSYAIQVFQTENRIDWASVAVLLVLPPAVWILAPKKLETKA